MDNINGILESTPWENIVVMGKRNGSFCGLGEVWVLWYEIYLVILVFGVGIFV